MKLIKLYMVKKKSDDKLKDTGSLFSMLKDLFADVIFRQIISWFKETLHDIQQIIYLTTKKVLESFLAMTTMILGIGMIVLVIPFLLSYYLELPASLFFVLIGLLLIIISALSFDHINRSKYKKF
jgi:uncharacterized membrane protein